MKIFETGHVEQPLYEWISKQPEITQAENIIQINGILEPKRLQVPKLMRRIYHIVREIWDKDITKISRYESQHTTHEHTKNARTEKSG